MIQSLRFYATEGEAAKPANSKPEPVVAEPVQEGEGAAEQEGQTGGTDLGKSLNIRLRNLLRFEELANANYRFIIGGLFLISTFVADSFLQNLQEQQEASEKAATPVVQQQQQQPNEQQLMAPVVRSSITTQSVRDAVVLLGLGTCYSTHILFPVGFAVGTILFDNTTLYRRVESIILNTLGYGNKATGSGNAITNGTNISYNPGTTQDNVPISLFNKLLVIAGVPFFRIVGQTLTIYSAAALATKAVAPESSKKSN